MDYEEIIFMDSLEISNQEISNQEISNRESQSINLISNIDWIDYRYFGKLIRNSKDKIEESHIENTFMTIEGEQIYLSRDGIKALIEIDQYIGSKKSYRLFESFLDANVQLNSNLNFLNNLSLNGKLFFQYCIDCKLQNGEIISVPSSRSLWTAPHFDSTYLYSLFDSHYIYRSFGHLVFRIMNKCFSSTAQPNYIDFCSINLLRNSLQKSIQYEIINVILQLIKLIVNYKNMKKSKQGVFKKEFLSQNNQSIKDHRNNKSIKDHRNQQSIKDHRNQQSVKDLRNQQDYQSIQDLLNHPDNQRILDLLNQQSVKDLQNDKDQSLISSGKKLIVNYFEVNTIDDSGEELGDKLSDRITEKILTKIKKEKRKSRKRDNFRREIGKHNRKGDDNLRYLIDNYETEDSNKRIYLIEKIEIMLMESDLVKDSFLEEIDLQPLKYSLNTTHTSYIKLLISLITEFSVTLRGIPFNSQGLYYWCLSQSEHQFKEFLLNPIVKLTILVGEILS